MFADAAPPFHHAGVNVVPVQCDTKVPLVPWKRWQGRSQTRREVTALIREHPAADIAIILRDLLDIETDNEEAERALRDLRLPLLPTACWRSPRGVHRIYQTATPLPSRLHLRPGLDVLAGGRYAIAPTSTGREWIIPLDALAPLPAAWHEVLRQPPRKASLRTVEATGADDGMRNDSMTALVGHWLTQGATDDELIRRALAWRHRCRPPLDEVEAEKAARSVLQTRQRTRSPEHALLMRARELDLSPIDRLTLMALAAHEHELGRAGRIFAAPQRLLAGLTGLGQASIARSYQRLHTAGVVELLPGRDPISGRKISTMRLRP